MKLKVIILVIFCYCPLIAQTKADCVIESPLDSSVRPKFFRNTATQTSLISDQDARIYLDHDEMIIGYCNTYFTNARTGYSKIEINCKNDYISINDYNYRNYNPTSLIFKCKPDYEKVTGKCDIRTTPNRDVRPKLFKKIGTRTMQISPEVPLINVQYGQEVTARCDTKFKSPNDQRSELNLICLKSGIVALGHPFEMSSTILECESLQWNLYESQIQFPWCPSSMASYILARPWLNYSYEYLAGICYNLEEMSFRSLYYAAKPKFAKNLSPTYLSTFKPLMEISNIDANFISKKTYIYDNPQIEKWINFSNYKNESILQNTKLHDDMLQPFDKLLNIDWWSGLQLGNWHFYVEALARHIESDVNEYDILAGISNVVTAPIRQESCNKNLTMVELTDSANNKLPLYIWNYLKSTRNASDEVVVIGVNTPFYDFYDEKDIVFCNDICHQIKWLENIHSTFRYRPMGVIFCCSAREVIASKRLDGFTIPKASVQSPLLPLLSYKFITPETTTVASVDTTVYSYDETTERELEYDEYGNLY